jgi:arsenate reductase
MPRPDDCTANVKSKQNWAKNSVPTRHIDMRKGNVMILYGLKNCDTCRKALKKIDLATFVDVRAEGVPDEILEKAIAQFGNALINSRSTTWRQMSDADREMAPLELLKKHPTVMKRPLIDRDGEFFLGWTPKVQSALDI